MNKIDDSDLKGLLVNSKLNTRGQYICDCPFCGKAQHFYISKLTQRWDCKKCSESGSIYKLLRFLNKSYLLEGATIEFRDSINGVGFVEEDEKITLEDLPVVKMPAGWKVCESSKYLFSRGLNKRHYIRYQFGEANIISKYKGYVLFPIYDNSKIRGFVGRWADKKVPKDKLRYNNSPGTDFSKLLDGFDEIIKDVTNTVILVEGRFDKVAVDRVLELDNCDAIKCCCTFGKKISPWQIAKLKSKGIINVILLYDFDALKEIKKYGFELEKNFFTNITYTSKKDIDECSKEEALEVFTRLRRPREFSENIISKVKM